MTLAAAAILAMLLTLPAASDAAVTPAERAGAATWTATGVLKVPRLRGHTATLLRTGKVLVVGGTGADGGVLNSAELYDPASGTWADAASLTTARTNHTANLLGDGTVIVAGGRGTGGARIGTGEVYNPTTGTWTAALGPMSEPSYDHAATLLSSNPAESGIDAGNVLISGGCCNASGGALFGAELYSPATKTFISTEIGFVNSHIGHTTTLLSASSSAQCGVRCGMVLAVGGRGGSSPTSNSLVPPELYDPKTRRWALSFDQRAKRFAHTATLLEDGRVLITGGTASSAALAATELFSPVTGVFADANPLNTARAGHAAVRLPGGKVLVAGGRAPDPGGAALASAELYDPAANAWSAVDPMLTPRAGAGYSEGPAAVLLTGSAEQCGANCGKVLVVGGTDQPSAELFGAPPEDGGGGGPGGGDPPGPGGDPGGGGPGGGAGGAGGVAGVAPGVPGAPGGGPPAGPAPESDAEARRARELRACLARAGRAKGKRSRTGGGSAKARKRARRRARQACIRRYGRVPGRVTGLQARAVSGTEIELSFVAPGTDGSRPPAARAYLVKQALGPIRGARDFSRAQSLCRGSCRFSVTEVGTRITLRVTGLRPGSIYYYAISARDNVSGRLGPRSAPATARTR